MKFKPSKWDKIMVVAYFISMAIFVLANFDELEFLVFISYPLLGISGLHFIRKVALGIRG